MADPTVTEPEREPGADPEPIVARRNWLPWQLGGLLAVAVAGAAILLLWDDPAPPVVMPSSPTSLFAEPEPEPEPEQTPEPEPTPPPPLLGYDESRLVNEASAIPGPGDSLDDGDYFAYLVGIYPEDGTVEFDIATFYVGQAAINWIAANNPAAENPPPNGFIIVNPDNRTWTIPLDSGTPVWNLCTWSNGKPSVVKRTAAEWAEAPTTGDLLCEAGRGLPLDPAGVYWFDVRGGAVAQVVGQYLP